MRELTQSLPKVSLSFLRIASLNKVFIRTRFWSIILLLVAGFFCIWNLNSYPLPWFDEGLNFQAPKNLLLYGQYAMRSSEGFRVLDPALQTGPPVVMLVAFSLKMFGFGLFQVRIVTSILTVLCVAAYWRIGALLYNRSVAHLAVILLLIFGTDNFVSFLYMGRQALGETSALFFFLAGLLLWFKSWKQPNWRYWGGAGFLFGLAMVTKSQFNLLVPPIILIIWLIGFFIFRILYWRHLLGPAIICVGCVLVWYGCQIIIVGPEQFALNAKVLHEGMQLHVLEFFNPVKIKTALGVLVRTGYIFWGSLALVYALWRLKYSLSSLDKLQQLAIIVFIGVWLAWYVFTSIGWSRYAFIAVTMSHIIFASLLYDCFIALISFENISLRRKSLQLISAFVLLLIVGWMTATGYPILGQILWGNDKSYFEFANYLQRTIPSNAVVESWEWELDLVTDLSYHHPPTEVTNEITYKLWSNNLGNMPNYDVTPFAPKYIIIGPFARWTNLYTHLGLINEAKRQVVIGQYELYQVTNQ